MDLIVVVMVLVYLLATGYLGYLGYRKTRTATDYLVAGRNANPIVMALSYGATFISTSAIVGFGGVAANFGMGLLWLTFLNIFVGIFIAFVFLGDPTRRMGHHLDAHTFPELMGRRFDSSFVHLFTAFVIFAFMPLYATAVIVGGAEAFAPTFHTSYELALYVFSVLVAAYVIAGGLKGVMLTDALQGAIMLAGMVVLLVVSYSRLGGVVEAHSQLSAMGDQVPGFLKAIGHQGWTSMPAFGFAAGDEPMPGAVRYHLWWIMVSTIVLGVGIGVLAQPQLIVRFMTVASQRALNRAVGAGGVFILAMVGVAYVVGALTNVYFAKHEVVAARILDDQVLMDPGEDGKAKLTLVAADAPAPVRSRARRFVSYQHWPVGESSPLEYVMWTPAMDIHRGAAGAPDEIRPRLVASARSVTLGTTLHGNTDTIIPRYIREAMPHWFGVVFVLTLLSAAMSTLSSQFHTIGTAIGRDLFDHTGRRGHRQAVLVTRLGVVVGIVVSVVLARTLRGNLIAVATAIFFGLCAATFLPSFLAAIFWRRMTRPAAIVSMLVGFVTSLLWLALVHGKTAAGLGIARALFGVDHVVPQGWSATWTVVDPLVVALPLSALTAILVTWLTPPMDPAHVAYCFGGPKPDAAAEGGRTPP
jgi:SSS family solute:Na+ symporter